MFHAIEMHFSLLTPLICDLVDGRAGAVYTPTPVDVIQQSIIVAVRGQLSVLQPCLKRCFSKTRFKNTV